MTASSTSVRHAVAKGFERLLLVGAPHEGACFSEEPVAGFTQYCAPDLCTRSDASSSHAAKGILAAASILQSFSLTWRGRKNQFESDER